MVMKKLILTITAIISFCGAQAQTTKGSIAITGKAGYTASDSKQATGSTHEYRFERSDYTLSPEIGLFVKDNLEVGVTARYFKQEDEQHEYHNGISRYHYTRAHYDKEVGLYLKQYKYLSERLAVTGTLSFGVSDLDYQTTSNHSAPFQNYNT